MSDQESGRDQRQSQRHRTLKKGRIYFNDNTCEKDCMVRDLSETGAKLKFEGWFDCPEFIVLQIPEGAQSGQYYDCQVMWRDNVHLGVMFIKKHDFPKDACN